MKIFRMTQYFLRHIMLGRLIILLALLPIISCKKDITTSVPEQLTILQVDVNGKLGTTSFINVNYPINCKIKFSVPIDTNAFRSSIYFTTKTGVSLPLKISAEKNDSAILITTSQPLNALSIYYLFIMSTLKSKKGTNFNTDYFIKLYTSMDSTDKFVRISDDQLLTLIQQQTFKYFYDYAHPTCGMARERYGSGDIVTTGGSGFGVMALIVGVERGFITRSEGVTRLDKILHFLETCDRFHGAWPHWINGVTGKTVPFSPNDDGGDLVETSFMIQGLITMRQYLKSSDPTENDLINRINALCSTVEYDWFTKGGQNSLYWHWSPTTGWLMNFRIEGYNETLITYVVAATSTTHPIPAIAYHQGYTRSGAIKNGNSYYGIKLPLGEPYGGPLFNSQYSFLGLDPRNLNDIYANYWEQDVNESLINHAYCKANPKNFIGYSNQCWGLTASDNPWGYSAHSPTNDLGVISPTAAVSALPYTPIQSMDAIRFFYYKLGDKLWGDYGFYDAFDMTENWWSSSYISIDQGPEICMIENYRTALLWNLFMSAPEVPPALTKLGFTFK